MVKVGDAIVFIDSSRKVHNALVTVVHGSPFEIVRDGQTLTTGPCINLVYVSDIETKSDPYGRQLERASSVSHEVASTAGGYCYRLKD